MEFNFRSVDQRSTSSSTYFSPSRQKFSSPPSNFSYFTQQSIRAGFGPNGVLSRDAMQRELEKERIRAEIIAEEIVRRRVLEEEVRKEMMMERELGFRFGPRPGPLHGPIIFEHRLPPLLTNFENCDRFGAGVGVGVSPHTEVGFRGSETLPFQRDPVVAGTGNGINANGNVNGLTLKEIKGNAVRPEVRKDKVIILAKPNANSADLKRKATTPPGAADIELAPVGLKKPKTKDDWSCALCRITATSERGLNEHLQGKKHQARERGMVSQRMGFGVGPLPKNTVANTRKPIQITNTSSSRKMVGKEIVKSSSTKVQESPTKKTPAKDTLLQKKENSLEKKENEEAAMPQSKPGSVIPKKKFRFWCEICLVGAYSQKVMNAHWKGKRHLSNLGQTGEPTPEQKTAQNVAFVEEKEPEVVAEEIKEETVAEPVEIKEVHLDGHLSATEDKDKVIAVAGVDVTIEQQNDEVLASSEKDEVAASAGDEEKSNSNETDC